MRELPTEREEFESNCVYVIWHHDFYAFTTGKVRPGQRLKKWDTKDHSKRLLLFKEKNNG